MAKYDPNWLMKERAKQWARQERELSHIEDKTKTGGHYSTMLCGRGWGGKGHPSITVVSYPYVTALPSCRTCREKFLDSIGVPYNEVGYPRIYKVHHSKSLQPAVFTWLSDALDFCKLWGWSIEDIRVYVQGKEIQFDGI